MLLKMNFISSEHLLLLFAIRCTYSFLLDQTASAQCVDSDSLDCPTVNATTNLCGNVMIARPVCPKYCGYCNITDGKWTTWTPWSTCDTTCSNGTQARVRTCTNPPPTKPYGLDCVGASRNVQQCHNTIQCPIHGEWSKWSSWGGCSQTCGVGMNRKDRHCDNPYPSLNGDHCFGEPSTYRICSERACTDGGWSTWGQWSTCSVTCGDGFRTRDRLCDNPTPSMLGKQCSGNSQMVTHCTDGHCQNGGWSTWGQWSTCSVTCGDGFRTRDRLCDNPTPSMLGKQCSGNSQMVTHCTDGHCQQVAFTANQPTGNLVGNSPTFQNIVTNIGGAYNSSTGKFTAPVSGLYSFAVMLFASYDRTGTQAVSCNVNKNTAAVARVYTYEGVYDSVSGSAYVHLSVGDIVDLSCAGWSYIHTSDMQTSFTGALIRAD